MKFQIILFLSLSAINFSCKRENCPFPGTTVEGTVIEDSTNVPIKGATVYLQRKKCGFDILGTTTCDYINVKDVESDENGKFKIRFCKSKHRYKYYYITVEKEGYFFDPDSTIAHEISLDVFYNSDRILKMHPK